MPDILHAVITYAEGMDHSIVERMQLESLTDSARIAGLVPINVIEIFDGTVDQARASTEVFAHLPDFIQRGDMDTRKLRLSVYQSDTASPEGIS